MIKSKILSAAILPLFLFLASCSTTNNLRKFDESNISKEIPADIAKKFEVKDAAPVEPTTAATAEKKSTKVAKKKIKKGKAMDKEPPTRRIDPMPFDVGEKLEYGVRYIGVTAGYLNLEVKPLKEVNSRKVYHLTANAKTVKIFELIYRVDDSIESFWDYDGLYSHRFTMDLDESKQNRKLIELYDYDKRQCFYWDRVDHSEKGFSEKKEQHEIPLWSQDVLSALYYIRTLKLPTTPEEPAVRFPAILDGKPWEVEIQYLKKGPVYANDKNYIANMYSLNTYQNGELKNKDNTIWMSDDEHRYLLRIEAKVKVGSFALALDKAI